MRKRHPGFVILMPLRSAVKIEVDIKLQCWHSVSRMPATVNPARIISLRHGRVLFCYI